MMDEFPVTRILDGERFPVDDSQPDAVRVWVITRGWRRGAGAFPRKGRSLMLIFKGMDGVPVWDPEVGISLETW